MLVDVTLRACAAGRRRPPPFQVRAALLDKLLDLAPAEIELPYASGDELPALLERARARAGHARLALWTRSSVTDVRAAAHLHPDRLAFGITVSEAPSSSERRIARGELARVLRRLIGLALQEGAGEVTLDLEDVDRADVAFALQTARVAHDLGATRIRLCDSLGQLSPTAMTRLIELFRQIPVQLAARCHDDFGLGTANAVTALLAGADAVDVAVLGAGGRGGVAHLEQVATYLACVHHQRPLRLDVLPRLVQDVRDALGPSHLDAGVALPSVEAALQVGGAFRDPALHETMPTPAPSGERPRMGEDTSAGGIANHLRRLGLAAAVDAETLAGRVRELARTYGRPLRDTELVQLVRVQMSAPVGKTGHQG